MLLVPGRGMPRPYERASFEITQKDNSFSLINQYCAIFYASAQYCEKWFVT